MKTIYLVTIIVLCTLIPLLFMLVVPIIIYHASWWWFFGMLIFELIVGFIVGLILLIVKLSKKTVLPKEPDLSQIKKKVVTELKNDEHNPDNFLIKNNIPWKIINKSGEVINLMIFDGRGTETNTRRVAIVNMNNLEKETGFLIDPTSLKEIDDLAMKIAGTYGEQIKEEITSTLDVLGRPTTTTKITKPSIQEIKQKEEQKEAEQKNIV